MFKKSRLVIPKNKNELNKHRLDPFYKTRDFRKKISFLYYPVLASHSYECNGRTPVFKLSKIAPFRQKPSTASTCSIKGNTSQNKYNHNKNTSVPHNPHINTRENTSSAYNYSNGVVNASQTRPQIK